MLNISKKFVATCSIATILLAGMATVGQADYERGEYKNRYQSSKTSNYDRYDRDDDDEKSERTRVKRNRGGVVTPAPVPTPTPAPPVVTPAPPVVTPAPPVVTPAPPVVTPAPPVVTPAPPVVTPAPVSGKTVFDTNCSSCHSLSGTSTMNLAGDGAKIASAHRTGSLSAAEKSALTSYLNSQSAPAPAPAPPVVTPAPPVVTPAPPVVTPAPPVVTPAPPVVTPAPPVVTPAPAIDGRALYNTSCAGCHGTSMLGKSASSIKSAITGNKGGMGFLTNLTAAQLDAIAQAR